MLVLGITGGVGAGKSTVLDHMKDVWGAKILQADQAAHQLQKKGEPCYLEIVRRFGEGILAADGSIDRVKLGSIVFSDQSRLEELNAVIHPAVKTFICETIAAEREKGVCDLLAIEAALLIEGGYREICDELWYIYASEEIRRERLKRTRGYSDERVDGIFKNQNSDELFRANCSVVIDTGISLEYTKEQVDQALRERIIK